MRTRKYNTALLRKAKKIKLIAMDIDGVLTTGSIIVLESGEEVKAWNVRDRIAFYYARQVKSGLLFAWISGRGSHQLEMRAQEIGIDALYQNCMKKSKALHEIARKYSLSLDEIAYIGDDLIDLPVLVKAGLSVCPRDAVPEVQDRVDLVSAYIGGKGVLREAVEIVLKAQGMWKKLVHEYTSS